MIRMRKNYPDEKYANYVDTSTCLVCGQKLVWKKKYENYGTFLTVQFVGTCPSVKHEYICKEDYRKSIHFFDDEIIELDHCWPDFNGTEEDRYYVEEKYNEITRQEEKKFLETIELLKTKYQYKAQQGRGAGPEFASKRKEGFYVTI